MLIKNRTRTVKRSEIITFLTKYRWQIGGTIGILLLLAGLSWQGFFSKKQEVIPFSGKVFCDAELVVGDVFITNRAEFGGGTAQSIDWKYRGKHSAKLDAAAPYGFTYKLQAPEAGAFYKVSAWFRRFQDGGGVLVASSPRQGGFYKTSGVTRRSDLGWELLELTIAVPKDYDETELLFYAFTEGQTVFVDDFTVERLDDLDKSYKVPTLHLEMSEKAVQKLTAKRNDALARGILMTTDEDWVKAEILSADELRLKVDLRLKGDWTDHLVGEKWSYRIKLKGEGAWQRLRTFSIQKPETRNFLEEWIYHRFLEKIDVLTPRYDFVRVFENGKDKGIYAYEEHFDKQIVEYKQRREGAIVRFDESLNWLGVQRELEQYKDVGVQHQQFADMRGAAKVLPFKEGKLKQSETLLKQFEAAQKLMQQYRLGTATADQIFDLDLLAKYYAATDIFAAYHGLNWINNRYYYNPITTKLEPIGFDGYSLGEEMTWGDKVFWGERAFHPDFEDGSFSALVRKDAKFMEKYTAYLVTFSKRSFFEAFLQEIDTELRQRERLLQTEMPDYAFDFEKCYRRVRDIRAHLAPFDGQSVQAYTQNVTANRKTVALTNFHKLPLKIIGFGSNARAVTDSLENPPLLYTNLKQQPPMFEIRTTDGSMKYVFYQLAGLDSVFTSEILAWSAPQGNTVPQQIFSQPTVTTTKIYTVKNKLFLFNKGQHTVTSDIIIPEGYTVIFPAGLTLNFIKKAKFISKSAVTMLGETDAPIVIQSSDKSANGFTVMQTAHVSRLHNVRFENFNTLKAGSWVLTGAVTFYEAEIEMRQCVFSKNHCEDGLNIVRSKFDIRGLRISETFSDGLDIDFGTGVIRDALFQKTGNDGMDFSGCSITVENARVEQAGDKGISVGEESNVFVKNIAINGAEIGVAAKDFSDLTLENITLKNCVQGFVAFRKKPEYGGAKISVEGYKTTEIRFLHKIERGSSLRLDDKLIRP